MKSSTKELICAVVALAVMAVILVLSGCTPLYHNELEGGRITYDRGGVCFDEPLTQEEVNTVISLLNGKRPESFLSGEYACGYGDAQAIRIGVTTYYLAQDECAYIQNKGNGKYYEISNEEREELEVIFRAHGAQYI